MKKQTHKNTKSITMHDVAQHAGVSRATVSRVLNNTQAPINISDATRQRVLNAVAQLGYRPNRLAQSLMTKNTRIIGLSMGAYTSNPDEIDDWHDFHTATLGKIVSGIQAVTVHREYDLQLMNRYEYESDTIPSHTNALLDFLEGVIYATPNPKYDLYTPIIEAGKPLVLIGPNPSSHKVSSVSTDNKGALYALTRALLRRGHRHIAIILPREWSVLLSQLREEGYRQAHEDMAVSVDPTLIIPNEHVMHTGILDEFFAGKATQYLLSIKPHPTAIIVAYSNLVVEILKRLHQQNIRVPDDIELVSYGDEQGFNTVEPGITALDIRLAHLGSKAAELLFEEIDGLAEPGRDLLYPPKLRIRGSCPLNGFFEPLPSWVKTQELWIEERR